MGLVSDLLNASITGQDLLVAVVTLASLWWAKIFYVCFLRAGKNLKKQYGEWAVVTGATDGIGKAMAVEFSKKGMKVLLISRDPKKLEDTKSELSGEGHETLAIDYSSFDDKKQEQVKKALEGKDLGILVNNVGVSYDFAEYSWSWHDMKSVYFVPPLERKIVHHVVVSLSHLNRRKA